MQKKKSKKQSLVRQVAFILGTYEGGTVEQNLPLAKYIVAHVKRHLTKRQPDGLQHGQMFNPYDLNEVAQIDKLIKRRR